MNEGTPPPERFPAGTSRYTLAMAKCLARCAQAHPSQMEKAVVHALVNLVQGRMLEYLADRICREFEIGEDHAQKRMVTVLMGIFSDEFFALFRTKIEADPELVIHIARRIIRKEEKPEKPPHDSPIRTPSDRFYPAIFRKYFEYRHLDMLLDMIESDAEIQRIILACLLERVSGDEEGHRALLELTDSDPEGTTANLFMGYIRRDNIETLLENVRSGRWIEDLKNLKNKMAHLRGEISPPPEINLGNPPPEAERKSQGG